MHKYLPGKTRKNLASITQGQNQEKQKKKLKKTTKPKQKQESITYTTNKTNKSAKDYNVPPWNGLLQSNGDGEV